MYYVLDVIDSFQSFLTRFFHYLLICNRAICTYHRMGNNCMIKCLHLFGFLVNLSLKIAFFAERAMIMTQIVK